MMRVLPAVALLTCMYSPGAAPKVSPASYVASLTPPLQDNRVEIAPSINGYVDVATRCVQRRPGAGREDDDLEHLVEILGHVDDVEARLELVYRT